MPPHGSGLPWGPRVSARRQNNQLELAFGTGVTGEARSASSEGTEADTATLWPESPAVLGPLMETIVERDNLRKALAQVRRNKGAPRHGLLTMALSGMDRSPAAIDGIDGMTPLRGSWTPQP